MSTRRRALRAAVAILTTTALVTPGGPAHATPVDLVAPLQSHLIAYYDFDHPVPGDPAREQDQGSSGTTIDLVNGGAAMRVDDTAYPGGGQSVQTGQVNPRTAGNDDWKAGVFAAGGVPSLRAFNAASGATIMGWFKMGADDARPNSNTADPNDVYNAIGLAGILTGDSDGHIVRALLEIITVNGGLRLVALGRRLDGGASQAFAANADWRTLLPVGVWVHLTATYDFDTGAMALYRNGEPVAGDYTTAGDPWLLDGPGPHVTSATDPRGIKIGGSFPQNTHEQNPCDCRMDALAFLDSPSSAVDVARQYRHLIGQR